MILWMSGVGFLSAFALGPAGFNVVRDLLSKKTWPWGAILGFLLGDLLYIGLALGLVQSPLLHSFWLKNILTLLTVFCLIFYSTKVLFFTKEVSGDEQNNEIQQGFIKSLLLTLANFHLVFIYAGLFLTLQQSSIPGTLTFGVLIYASSFVASFLFLLLGLSGFRVYLKTALRKAEVVAACGFLSFSLYLLLEFL